jgi:hypothetical protein
MQYIGCQFAAAVKTQLAEHGHHRVADVLLDPTAMLVDGLACNREQARKERPNILRIERLAERCRADDVGSQLECLDFVCPGSKVQTLTGGAPAVKSRLPRVTGGTQRSIGRLR